MGGLVRKMQRAAEREKPRFGRTKPFQAKQPDLTVTQEGIFCDCYGTLYSHSFKKDELLVAYLNAQLASGAEVSLISTNPHQVMEHIRDIGLHEDILFSIRDKSRYFDEVFEVLIDDDPSMLRAKTLWHPQNPEFRKHMQDFVDQNPVTSAPEEPKLAL